jgi:hypothetical protein
MLNEINNFVNNGVNKYIEEALSKQNANIHSKFNEVEMFDFDKMYKKIGNKLFSSGYSNIYEWMNQYEQIRLVEYKVFILIKEYLDKFNIKMYIGYDFLKTLYLYFKLVDHRSSVRFTIYTDTNLIIYVNDPIPWNDNRCTILFSSNDIIPESKFDFVKWYSPKHGNLLHSDINQSDSEKMSKLIKYIHPNIYADYMMCMDENNILGILNDEIVNKEMKEMKNKIHLLSAESQISCIQYEKYMKEMISNIQTLNNQIENLSIKNDLLQKSNDSKNKKYDELVKKCSIICEDRDALWRDYIDIDYEFKDLSDKYCDLCDKFNILESYSTEKSETIMMQLNDYESKIYNIKSNSMTYNYGLSKTNEPTMNVSISYKYEFSLIICLFIMYIIYIYSI